MMTSIEKSTFGPIDYSIFIGLFLLSSTVGAIFAYRDRKKQTTDNYYFGGKAISPFLVSISIAVSFISALAIVAFPAEVYLYGIVYFWFLTGFYVSSLLAILYYIPLFHRLQISSVYEYLELRFHRYVRVAASILGIFSTTSYLAISIYLPALALNAVTPIDLASTIFLTSAVCTLYTALGGMKAVLWVDAIQCVVMIVGIFTILGSAVSSLGGFAVLVEKTVNGGRNNLLKFDFNPTVRSSAPAAIIGGSTISCYEILCNQIYIQRWLSCKSIRSSRKSVLLSVIPVTLFGCTSLIIGLALFAYYEGCDPLRLGTITKPDQLMPALAVDLSQSIPGLSGLFVASAFCGTMSTVSSGINALSAVFLMDFCLPNLPRISEKRQMMLSKALKTKYTGDDGGPSDATVIAIVFGALVMGGAYLVSMPSTNVMGIFLSLYGFFAGPIVGVFTMGLFMPWINSLCVSVGFATGLFSVGLVGVSAMMTPSGSARALPTSIDECPHDLLNFTTTISPPLYNVTSPFNVDDTSYSAWAVLGLLSPFLYGALGILGSIIGANVAWLVVGGNDTKSFDERLFTPIVSSTWLPRNLGNIFRCGVPMRDDEYKDYDFNSGRINDQLSLNHDCNTNKPILSSQHRGSTEHL